MSASRTAGILVSLMGVVFLLVFVSMPVNPDVTIGNIGLMEVLLGLLAAKRA